MCSILCLSLICVLFGTANAKSVFAVSDHGDSIIKAYKINSDKIKYQNDVESETFSAGATGLCVWPSKELMFVTYEGSKMIAWCSTKTFQRKDDDEYITPEVPNTSDNITIFVSGVQSAGPVEITNSEFLIDDTSLELDLFLDVGLLQVVTPWNYFEDIGTLPAGTYDLLVKTDQPAFSDPEDSYSITFEVVPEPASLLLIAFGAIKILGGRKGIIAPIMA